MRNLSKLIAAASATVATAGMLGMAGAAQAQTTGPRVLTASPSTVSANIVTGVNVTNPCPSGTTPKSVSGLPKPNLKTTNVQAVLAPAPTAVRLAGVWPTPGKTSYSVKVTCPAGQTGTSTVNVVAAPAREDVVGVGSDTIQNVMDQFSADFNKGLSSATSAHLYSWDATNPITGAIGDNIVTKHGCAAIPRPDGSSGGITALDTQNKTTGDDPCMDFARSSRDRAPTDPPYAANGIAFTTLAGDAVTWATQPGTNAPASLTAAQLNEIYSCTVTNWNQVGGKSGTIAPFIPQPSSGTRAFFLAAIGVTTPGSCVSDDNGNLEENEGVNPVLNTNKANVIFPFSVGKYLAERYHSAKCFNTGCTTNSAGFVCTPGAGQNLFGCNTRGTMQLMEITPTGSTTPTAPTTPFPLTSKTTKAIINKGFASTFQRLLFEVVPFSTATGNVNHIASNLVPFFGPKGFVCTNSTAKKDLTNYGFLVLPTSTINAPGDCGSTH